jgi:hypothetical protein
MKFLRLIPAMILFSGSAVAFAQTSANSLAPSEGQKSFDTLKTLAGNWEGPVTVDPPQPDSQVPKNFRISMRVTSRGNALVHELQEAGTPLDPTKYDHPVTMFYLDNDRLNLVHYCDAGNRPHMIARKPVDAKTLEFDFVDYSGGNQYGHMYHVLFTLVDANHHTEDWTFLLPGDKPEHARFDLHRVP